MAMYFNENGQIQHYEESSGTAVCKACGKRYIRSTEEQVPGFRDKSYDDCPYCGHTNGSSMDEEYHNSKMEGDE